MNSILEKELSKFLSYFRLNINMVECIHEKELGFSVVSFTIPSSVYKGENKKEFLDAFSYIVKHIINSLSLEEEYLIDINGETCKEIEYIKEITAIASKRVLQFGKPYEFGRLSSFKRMLVHHLTAQIPGVSTVSEGQGIDRRLKMIKE